MWELIVATPWGKMQHPIYGEGDAPAIHIEYDVVDLGFEDITGQHPALIPSNPNLFNVKVQCTYAVLQLILADPDYIVWTYEEIVDASTL